MKIKLCISLNKTMRCLIIMTLEEARMILDNIDNKNYVGILSYDGDIEYENIDDVDLDKDTKFEFDNDNFFLTFEIRPTKNDNYITEQTIENIVKIINSQHEHNQMKDIKMMIRDAKLTKGEVKFNTEKYNKFYEMTQNIENNIGVLQDELYNLIQFSIVASYDYDFPVFIYVEKGHDIHYFFHDELQLRCVENEECNDVTTGFELKDIFTLTTEIEIDGTWYNRYDLRKLYEIKSDSIVIFTQGKILAWVTTLIIT